MVLVQLEVCDLQTIVSVLSNLIALQGRSKRFCKAPRDPISLQNSFKMYASNGIKFEAILNQFG